MRNRNKLVSVPRLAIIFCFFSVAFCASAFHFQAEGSRYYISEIESPLTDSTNKARFIIPLHEIQHPFTYNSITITLTIGGEVEKHKNSNVDTVFFLGYNKLSELPGPTRQMDDSIVPITDVETRHLTEGRLVYEVSLFDLAKAVARLNRHLSTDEYLDEQEIVLLYRQRETFPGVTYSYAANIAASGDTFRPRNIFNLSVPSFTFDLVVPGVLCEDYPEFCDKRFFQARSETGEQVYFITRIFKLIKNTKGKIEVFTLEDSYMRSDFTVLRFISLCNTPIHSLLYTKDNFVLQSSKRHSFLRSVRVQDDSTHCDSEPEVLAPFAEVFGNDPASGKKIEICLHKDVYSVFPPDLTTAELSAVFPHQVRYKIVKPVEFFGTGTSDDPIRSCATYFANEFEFLVRPDGSNSQGHLLINLSVCHYRYGDPVISDAVQSCYCLTRKKEINAKIQALNQRNLRPFVNIAQPAN